MRRFIIVLAVLLTQGSAFAQNADHPLVGDWEGTLQVQEGVALPLILHLRRTEETWSVSLDSPAQNVTGIPGDAREIKEDAVDVIFPTIGGSYEATRDGDTLEGRWRQGPLDKPLTLTRAAGPAGDPPASNAPKRPQTPQPPFPYEARETSCSNGDVTLAGTLTLPKGDGPVPGVVFITGSGPQDRDETIAGHRPFLVIADHLARRGIASFRYDDRGTAGSTGDYFTATLDDFAGDAAAALSCFEDAGRVDAARTGFLGHSEGAWTALRAVTGRDAPADFLITLGGPGADMETLLLDQGRRIANAAGANSQQIQAVEASQREAIAIMRDVETTEARRAAFEALYERLGRTSEQGAAEARYFASPYWPAVLGYDPAEDLGAWDKPILVISGGKDLQVHPETNLPPIREALGSNDAAAIIVFDDLNHLMQTADTGSPQEYAAIEETIAPRALERITAFIKAVD